MSMDISERHDGPEKRALAQANGIPKHVVIVRLSEIQNSSTLRTVFLT